MSRGRRSRLIASLGNPDESARNAAVAWLRQNPDPKLAGELIHHLRAGLDGTPELLLALGPGAAPALVRSLAHPKPLPAVDVLGRIGEGATDALLGALDQSNRQVRLLAAFALGRSGDPAVPMALIGLVESGRTSPELGVSLIEWLRHHHPAPEVLDRILAIIQSGSAPPLLSDFIRMLIAFQDPRLVPILAAILEDRSTANLWRASMMTLSRIADPAAEPTLLRVLVDDTADLGMRMDAICGLARLMSAAALAPLRDLASSNQPRPVLPGPLPPDEARPAMERSLREQRAWKLKLMALAALAHMDHPSRPLQPDYALMQPIPAGPPQSGRQA